MRLLFELLRRFLILTTGHGYDRSSLVNDLHHKLAYRLHKLLPIFGIRGVQRIAVSTGHHLYVRAEDGGVGHQWITYKRYEPFESSLIKKHVTSGMTVYNVGANVGYYTLLASQQVGASGQVIAFEPAPTNVELLARMIEENQLTNVHIMPIAVGASDGVATLSLSASNSGDHQVYSGQHEDRLMTEVPLRSLDSLLAEGFRAPDAIIMDVQGSELDALRGMARALHSVKIIFTEFWPGGLNARHGNGAQEFLTTLSNAGFTFQVIDEKRKSLQPISIDQLLLQRPAHEELNLLCTR